MGTSGAFASRAATAAAAAYEDLIVWTITAATLSAEPSPGTMLEMRMMMMDDHEHDDHDYEDGKTMLKMKMNNESIDDGGMVGQWM